MPGDRNQRSISTGNSTINASIDLPCLPIGCSVSAKYRGAFCSAQVKSIEKQVKIKVTLLDSGENVIISDEQILSATSLHIGNTITVRCPTSTRDVPSNSSRSKNHQKKQAIIKQITDNSIYTVVFNDGDETSLRRASLCLQGIRLYQNHIGQSKVFQTKPSPPSSTESTEKNPLGSVRRPVKNQSQTLPTLILQQQTMIDSSDGESNSNPSEDEEEEEDDNDDDNDDDQETTEEKDSFLAKLLAFMDDRGTPINHIPKLHNADLDLHRLFKVVRILGGSNKVTKNRQWDKVHLKMGLADALSSERGRAIEQAYKKYLYAYEDLDKKLGTVSASNSYLGSRTNINADSRRSLIRRRSQTIDETLSSSLKDCSNLSSRKNHDHHSIRRSSSSSTSDTSDKRIKNTFNRKRMPLTRRKYTSIRNEKKITRYSRKRSTSSIGDDPSLKPVIKISKLSSNTINNWPTTTNDEQSIKPLAHAQPVTSECLSIIPSNRSSSEKSNFVLEEPSIFQTLLTSSLTSDQSRQSISSVNSSETNEDRPWISIEQVLQRSEEVKIVVPKVAIQEEQRPASTISSSYRLSSCSTDDSSPQIQNNSNLSKPIRDNQSFDFRHERHPSSSPIDSDTTLIRAGKRRLGRDTNPSPSLRQKPKIPSDLDESSPAETKRFRTVGKRTGKRSIQHLDMDMSLNSQLRQRLEDMFKNRSSRYNFLDLNENLTGDRRLEHLKDRLSQCQKVFFNLQLALTKIEDQRQLFLQSQIPSDTSITSETFTR